MPQEHFLRTFAKLMLAGKVNAATRMLDREMSSGVLQLSDETLDQLRSKHRDVVTFDATGSRKTNDLRTV